jgi:hypothetical protein
MSTPSRAAALRDTRGAVYVEFLIAFLPFFVLFLCLWQVSILYYAKLLVDHAAFSAARAGAVVIAESSDRVGDTDASTVNKLTDTRAGMIKNAVDLALAPIIVDGTIGSIDIAYPQPDKPGGPDAMSDKSYPAMGESTISMTRVRVTANFVCRIAFADVILCPTNFFQKLLMKTGYWQPTLPIVSEAVFPFQGANYTYKSN